MFLSKGKIPGNIIERDDNPSSPKQPDSPRCIPKNFEYVFYIVSLKFAKEEIFFD